MGRKVKSVAFVAVLVVVVLAAIWLLSHANTPVLNPKGEVAAKQKDLLLFAIALIGVVVVPVFVLLVIFSLRYREGGSKRAAYRPEWADNRFLEALWWGIPLIIITVLSVVTWNTSHDLDPYKSLVSDKKPITVQVVALQWKWLFIYPDQKIASVNFMQMPVNTPINFEITSDAPMNAFWIPSLGSQVYAMSGMSMKLHLNATEPGDYPGASSNISGRGFADMKFVARASSEEDFSKWVTEKQHSVGELTQASYDELAKPASEKEPRFYKLGSQDLYDSIVMKYMSHPVPQADKKTTEDAHDDHSMMHHQHGGGY